MKPIFHLPINKYMLHKCATWPQADEDHFEHDDNGRGDAKGDGPDQTANQQTFIGPLKGLKILSFNFLGAWLWPATGFSFISLVFGSSKPFIVGHKEFMCVQKTWIWPPLAMSLWIIVLDPSGPFQTWPTQNFKDKSISFCVWNFCGSQQNFGQIFGIFGNGGP